MSDGTIYGRVFSIYVVGTDVYAGGFEGDGGSTPFRAKTWKNGVVTYLSDGTNNGTVRAVYVSGSDVYASGEKKQRHK